MNTVMEVIYLIGLDAYEGNAESMDCIIDNVICALASPLVE